MGELSKLPNIGKAVEAQLIQVGIETSEALRQVGAKAAKKTELSDAMKADLKAFYQEHKL